MNIFISLFSVVGWKIHLSVYLIKSLSELGEFCIMHTTTDLSSLIKLGKISSQSSKCIIVLRLWCKFLLQFSSSKDSSFNIMQGLKINLWLIVSEAFSFLPKIMFFLYFYPFLFCLCIWFKLFGIKRLSCYHQNSIVFFHFSPFLLETKLVQYFKPHLLFPGYDPGIIA